jgi:hypothetical protein
MWRAPLVPKSASALCLQTSLHNDLCCTDIEPYYG